jgi:nucleoside-diphosphate-sugar epimerase
VEEIRGAKCSLAPERIALAKKTPEENLRPLRSIERAREELGCEPRYDLPRGVEDSVKLYRECSKTLEKKERI